MCVYLSSTQDGFSFASLRKKGLSPFHLVGVLHLSALAPTTRCLCAKRWANPFHLQVFCIVPWSLDQTNWFRHSLRWCFTPFAPAQSTLCLCTKKWANPCHHGCVCRTASLFNIGDMQLHATISNNVLFHLQSSQFVTGGLLPIALTRPFALLAVFDGGSAQNRFCTTSERKFH